MKKLLALTLALLMVLTLVACGKDTKTKKNTKNETETVTATETEPVTETYAESQVTPLLYKVSDKDGDVVWLFGSIHVGIDEMYPLPGYVYKAFDNADYLALECDVVAVENDYNAVAELYALMVYTDGTTIKDHISEDLYEDAVEALEDAGQYNQFLDYYMPSMWSTILDQTTYDYFDFDMLKGVDRHLTERANDRGKEIVEIESNKAHYQMMADYSDPLQEMLLEESVYYYKDESVKEEINDAVTAWCAGDEEELRKLLTMESAEDAGAEEDEVALYEEYVTAMITERDLLMTDFAEEALKNSEEAFIVVGDAHVLGNGGMVDQLRDRGYTVEAVK